MKVDIQGVTYDTNKQLFIVVKNITGDGPPELNSHYIPVMAVRSHACFYGITEAEALDLILFEPFVTVADHGNSVNETVGNIKTRVQAGVGLASCHQSVLEEVRKHGTVSETHLDSPGGVSGRPSQPGPGKPHGG